jgi:hypothetical protein
MTAGSGTVANEHNGPDRLISGWSFKKQKQSSISL